MAKLPQVDVLVVGGGLAGLAAAVSAAAAGAHTLLLERGAVLGGNASQAYVHTFCGLYEPPDGGRLVYANPGFAAWFAEGLRLAGGALDAEVHGAVGVLPIYPPRLAGYAERIARAFSSLSVLCGTSLVSLHSDPLGDGAWQAAYSQKGTIQQVRARVIIDTSGDAAAARLASADVELPCGEDLQTATLIFRVSGANAEDMAGFSRLRFSAAMARGARSGDLPPDCDSIMVRPGELPDEAYVSLNLPKPAEQDYAPLDPEFMRLYTEYAHALAGEVINYLRDSIPGWADCRLLAWPQFIGIREGARVLGHHVLSEEEILSGAVFDDAVARSTWPIELWHSHTGADFRYPSGPSQVPLRALISRSHANLGMAGRCMSASHEAMGALRVLGTAMATGEAVGLAAATAVDTGVPLAEVAHTEVLQRRDFLIDSTFNQP